MNEFREEFQRLLESTYIPTVGDRAENGKKMDDFLNYAFQNIPEKLYRYRQCDEKGYSLDSFKYGTISVCNAKRFSDKYDSRVYVDREKILKELKDGFNHAIPDLLLKEIRQKNPMLKSERAANICHDMECGLSDQEIIDKIIKEQYADFIHEIETDMKSREFRFRGSEKTAKIGCFTENVQSKFMWDHYAGGYTGFALEYNLKEFVYKHQFYKQQSNPDTFAYVFPVIYSDEMPDVTDDESNAYMREKSLKEEWMRSWAHLYHSIPLNALHMYKPYLYKDRAEYAHEKEWRMIYYDSENKDDFSLIPDMNCLKAIYYGPDISEDNKAKLHKIAKEKGIAEYDVSFDLDSRAYGLKVTSSKNT
jgi:hypothetical protein